MARPLALATILLAAATGAHAQERDLASRIDRVTVFPDGASVTRIAEIDLPAGSSTVMLRGLPASLDPASLQISGEASGRLQIGAVDVRIVPGDPKGTADPALEARILALRQTRETLVTRLAALEARRTMIERYAQSSPERLGDNGSPLAVERWPEAWNAVGDALAKVGEEIRQGKVTLAEHDAELQALEKARPRPAPTGPRRDVIVALDASAPVKGKLSVAYRVSSANWRPVYEARLDTANGTGQPALELIRRAAVTQRSGEDWRGVAMSISTVRVARATAAPDLPPLEAGWREPAPVAETQSRLDAPAPMARSVAAAPDAAVAAAERETQLDAGAFQATFTVPGRIDVVGDGTTTNLRLTSRTLAPALSVRTVPALDTSAWLEAAFDNAEEAPLLPGEVSLTRDGTYVGRGRFALIAPGDKVRLGFGVDHAIKVTREPVSRQETEPGFLNNARTDTRDFRITVRNLHRFAIPVTVIDRIPYSENANLVVEQLPQTTPPSVKQVDNRRGVMAWTGDIAPGGQREIRVAYRLRWPADREIELRPAPVR